jgi:16S rRNA processing protein RimM
MKNETSSPVVVARIIKPHALTGEVVLESYTDVQGRLEELRSYLVMQNGEVIRTLEVESYRFFNDRYVVKFRGINSRNEADALRNKELAIPEQDVGQLPADHFFIHDLVGMTVYTREGKEVGIVQNVMKTGGVDLLEVGEEGRILIPFVDPICKEVDLETRRIIIDPPEGLLNLNAR